MVVKSEKICEGIQHNMWWGNFTLELCYNVMSRVLLFVSPLAISS